MLVERIEGFCAPADWLRAYGEINDFEEQLSEYGIIVVKFWLAIDKQTQMERFKEREKTPTSATRSPRKTGATATSGTSTWTRWATWSTVPAPRSRLDPGRSQRQALRRVKVLRTINDAIEAAYKKDK